MQNYGILQGYIPLENSMNLKSKNKEFDMSKKLGFVLLCALLGTVLEAENVSESQKFIGVEVTITEVQGDAVRRVDPESSQGTGFGLRLGAQNEEWRTMFTFNYFDNEGRNVEKLFLSVDYFFLKSELTENYAIQPYLGVNVGYMNYEAVGVDESGLLYGGQAGGIFNLTESLDFDLGYRYSLSSSDALDHTGDVVFGLNYLY